MPAVFYVSTLRRPRRAGPWPAAPLLIFPHLKYPFWGKTVPSRPARAKLWRIPIGPIHEGHEKHEEGAEGQNRRPQPNARCPRHSLAHHELGATNTRMRWATPRTRRAEDGALERRGANARART